MILALHAIFECNSKTIVLTGAAGAAHVTKLLNNALTVSNRRNIVAVLGLAQRAGGRFGHSAEGGGGSFIPQAVGRQITPKIVHYIAALNQKDVHEFGDAMRASHLDPSEAKTWAMAGPDGLPKLVEDMTGAEKGASVAAR